MFRLAAASALRRAKLTCRRERIFSYEYVSSSTKSGTISSRNEEQPILVELPSVPLLGSMVHLLSGPSKLDMNRILLMFYEIRSRHGSFVKMGFPGFGKMWRPDIYLLSNPVEYTKVLQREGKYPDGASLMMWPLHQYYKDVEFGRAASLSGHGGPEWKRIRSFVQTDLLAPKSAARYIPGVIRAAQFASKGAELRTEDFYEYLNECAFDMIMAVLLGLETRVADSTFQSSPEHEKLCTHLSQALKKSVLSRNDLVARIAKENFGMKTKGYLEFEDVLEPAMDAARDQINILLNKRNNGQLTQAEESSYINQAMNRQEDQTDNPDPMQVDEVINACLILIKAGVDTTAGKMMWHILHLAQNTQVQEQVRQEILEAVSTNGGELYPEMLSPKKTPLLHAFMRESHRIANPTTTSPIRTIAEDMEIHGTLVPKGSTVVFDGFSLGMDPDFVEDPGSFRIERFLPDAVSARKGTKAEMLDHPLMSSPFSQGTRRCPGSRVAMNEVSVMLSQLLLDWSFSAPPLGWKDVHTLIGAGIYPLVEEIEVRRAK